MRKGVPIKPSDIPEKSAQSVPPFVFDVINDLLLANGNGKNPITISEQAIVTRVEESQQREFDPKWLAFQDDYGKQGWSVTYVRAPAGQFPGNRYVFSQ